MRTQDQDESKRERYDAILFCRAPVKERDAVEKAARENLMSISTYVRQAVAMRLRAEGAFAA